MSAPAILSPRARADLRAAVARIAEDNPAAAHRRRQEVEDAARMLGARPALGRRRQPALLGDPYRLWSLRDFPFVLVYDVALRPPLILRCLHTARDVPGVLSDLRP